MESDDGSNSSDSTGSPRGTGPRRWVALVGLLAVASLAAWLGQREPAARPQRNAPPADDSIGVTTAWPAAAEPSSSAPLVPRREAVPPAAAASLLTIAVRVVDEAARPIPTAEVIALADLVGDPAADRDATVRVEQRCDGSGLAIFALPRAQALALRWVVARHADAVPAVEFIGDRFTDEALAAATVAITVVLEAPRPWSVRVADVHGRPIAGATVEATAAWGTELRGTAVGDAAVRRRLALDAVTDATGRASLPLCPTLPYFVEAFADGFAPFAVVVLPDDASGSSDEIVLRRLYVAGYRLVGGTARDLGMIATEEPEQGTLERNPRWWSIVGRLTQALRAKLERADAQLLFRLEQPSGAPPADEPQLALLNGEERELTFRFRPLDELLASDLVELEFPPPGTATLHVQLVAEEGEAPDAEFGWWLQRSSGFRAAHPSSIERERARLTFSGLEAGGWRLTTPNLAFRRLLRDHPPIELRDGEEREIEVVVPAALGLRLRLTVRDAFGRPLTRYQATLRTPSGFHAVLDQLLLPIEPGRYSVTVHALGYPDCTVELDLDGRDVAREIVVDAPSGMTLPWQW